MSRGHFDLALGQIDRALEINPSDADSAVTKAAILLLAGRAAETVPCAKHALGLDPTDAGAALYLGLADYLRGHYDEAVEALDRALAGNLGRIRQLLGRSVLAAAYAELDQPADAARERDAALQLSPSLDAGRFAGQFGAQPAPDHMLDGLKKAGFR